MKRVLGGISFLLLAMCPTVEVQAQELLYNDKGFKLSRSQWNSQGTLRDSAHQPIMDTANVALYQRNDSLFVACEYELELVEYSLHHWKCHGELRSIQVSGRGVVIITSKYYDSHIGSAWSEWFENSTDLLIIDMVEGTVLFSGTTEYSFSETTYEYEGNFMSDTLSEEEARRMYNERTERNTSCMYKYVFEVGESSLKITLEEREQLMGEKLSRLLGCSFEFAPGLYLMRDGAYIKAED